MCAPVGPCGASFLRTPRPPLAPGPLPLRGAASARRARPRGPGRSPRLPRSARVRRCRGSPGACWPRCASALPLLRCGLPVRSALLRAGRGSGASRVPRRVPPWPSACWPSSLGPASPPRGFRPGGSRPGAVGGLRRPSSAPAPGRCLLRARLRRACLALSGCRSSGSALLGLLSVRPGALLRWWLWGSPRLSPPPLSAPLGPLGVREASGLAAAPLVVAAAAVVGFGSCARCRRVPCAPSRSPRHTEGARNWCLTFSNRCANIIHARPDPLLRGPP